MATYEHVLVNASLERVVASDAGLSACYGVSASPRQCFLYPDRRLEGNGARALAGPLSERLGVAILAADVYDSDVLRMDIFKAGQLSHHYNSMPDLSGDSEYPGGEAQTAGGSAPIGADPSAFAEFAARPIDQALLARALDDRPADAAEATEDGGYIWAQQQHRDILTALGLPAELAMDYRYLSAPWPLLPVGIRWDQLALFGDAAVPPLMTPDLLGAIRTLLRDRTASFADIAETLEVSTGAIFRHVPDLRDIRQGRTPH